MACGRSRKINRRTFDSGHRCLGRPLAVERIRRRVPVHSVARFAVAAGCGGSRLLAQSKPRSLSIARVRGCARRPSAKPPGVRKPAGALPSRRFIAFVQSSMISRIASSTVCPRRSHGARWNRNCRSPTFAAVALTWS